MVELIHPPDPQLLLPPILACLPTAFASPRPPPALLSLLSPILRQRLSYISSSDNWLKLLCWDSSKSDSLLEQVEEATFEPHPSSGEIEVGDISSIKYKRFDEETLRAQLSLSEWPFTPVFLWCPNSDSDSSWQLAELLPCPNLDSTWCESISHANDSARERIMAEALEEAESQPTQQRAISTLSVPKEEDDYWAQYDQSPGRTPARKSSVPLDHHPSQSNEADYYARYTSVQPAMDNHDPDEEMADGQQIESTLNGHAHQQRHQQPQHPLSKTYSPSPPQDEEQTNTEVLQPLPSHISSPSDSSSAVVSRLESAAETYSDPSKDKNDINNSHHESSSEIGIRQHVSTTIKSLYRLSASVGITGSDFRDMVVREIEGLRILEMNGDED